jgi:2EXR family
MKDTKIGNNTLTKFTLFPKLAVELQDEIWKHVARLQSRIVALEWYETADEKRHSKDADTGHAPR